MKVTVNNTPLELFIGAKVKDAVIKYYSSVGKRLPDPFPSVEDRYGNHVDSDGELTDGSKLVISEGHTKTMSSTLKTILLLLVFGFSACATGQRKTIATASALQSGRQAVILAVNDMHASIDNFPKFEYIIDSLRTLYPDMLIVAAGDNQTGNPVNDQYPVKGLPMIELMNAIGFNLSATGNHEFDSHPDGFSILTHKADFDFICSNVTAADSLNIKISPYKIITLPNGLRLAFISLLNLNQNGIPDTHPDNTDGFTFRPPFEVAREYMYLRKECDIFIALTHLGFEEDVKLAEELPAGLDLIIGGHSHTRVDREQVHNGILITQAENKLKYATLIRMTLRDDGTLQRSMNLINIRDSKKENYYVRAMVDKYNDNPVLNEVVATSTDDFSSYEELGYLMADAQRDAAGADIALVNPGGVRIDRLAKGPVTKKNIYQLDPFGNELVLTSLTGNEIESLMIAAYPIDDREAIITSGLRTIVHPGTNGTLASVELLTMDGRPLDMEKTYLVAMNSYMTQVYHYNHSDPGKSLYITTADATISYLKKLQTIGSYHGVKRVEVVR